MSERTGPRGASQVLLCVDTSSDAAVAVCRTGAAAAVQVLAQARSRDGRRHAETLVPMIQQVLEAAGLGVDGVDAVAVGTGPAPFTGLRVGLITARAFARARGIDAYGVCSLDALALAAADPAVRRQPAAPNTDEGREVLVVTDAKRREVYYARYRVDGDDLVALAGPAVAIPDHVAAEHADLVTARAVFGPALTLYADVFDTVTEPDGAGSGDADADARAEADPAGLAHRSAPVDPAYLARIAVHRRRGGADLSLTPQYLRRPDVHVSTSRKRAS